MEEEKNQDELKHWKELLVGHPDAVVIREMPREVAEVLSHDPEVSPDVAEAIVISLAGAGGSSAGGEGRQGESAAAAAMRLRREREEREEKVEQQKKLSLMARIAKLDMGEKAKLARTGDKETRSILVKDPNKLVSMAVIGNPKITIQEIEMIAASRNVVEDILREISKNKDWCGSYAVVLALVNNPKTPVGVSLTYLPRLLTRDIRFIARSKAVPEAVRATAKRIAQRRAV